MANVIRVVTGVHSGMLSPMLEPAEATQFRVELERLRAENAQLRREVAVLWDQADPLSLARALYQVEVMSEAERIAERPENLERVLATMYARAPEKDRARWRAAVEKAATVRVRLRARAR